MQKLTRRKDAPLKCKLKHKKMSMYEKHLEAIKLMDLPPFYGNKNGQLMAEELTKEIKDIAKITNWNGKTKSQMLINSIRGPGFAQTWNFSWQTSRTGRP
jgi:hypothetical protein